MESIDIIMPTYNCEKYIKDAIQSVKNQTYKNWKLIIIDDASTDNTIKEIEKNIKKIEAKTLLIKLHNHVGVAEARNIEINESKSKYIAFLDADDIWEKNKLEEQINFMKSNNYVFTYTSYTYLKNNKQKQVKCFPNKLEYKQALGNTFILTSTVILDTEKIDKKLIKMPNVESEDTATWWKILKKGNIAYGLNKNLTIYRITPNGLSSNKFKNIKRTWNLYRKQENLTIIKSMYYFINYIFHATIKRII